MAKVLSAYARYEIESGYDTSSWAVIDKIE
jgi:hypothetical protein